MIDTVWGWWKTASVMHAFTMSISKIESGSRVLSVCGRIRGRGWTTQPPKVYERHCVSCAKILGEEVQFPT